MTVDVGLGAGDALRAHAGHFRRVRDGRPHVTLKLAISADGKAGLSGRKPAAITGEAARARVHLMRAMNDAVLTGIGTVLADDPQLTCRLPGMEHALAGARGARQRICGCRRNRGWSASATRTLDWVFVDEAARPAHEDELTKAASRCCACRARAGRLDLAAVLRALAGRGITRVMVEAGPILSAAFLAADLVDEAALFRSPIRSGRGSMRWTACRSRP